MSNSPVDTSSAPYVYFVHMWCDPNIETELLAWLDAGGHTAEVLSQPGFLWSTRYRLEQNAADGWHAYAILYALRSQQDLEHYFANKPLHEKFARQRARFDAGLRTDRMWGGLHGRLLAPG